MFADHEVTVAVRYDQAAARLARLISQGALDGVSLAAYEGGLEMYLRVGPFGNSRGLSKLVRARALDPVRRGATMTVSLRWEATGVTGDLFPALDAELILMREGENRSRLGLIGSYRPPLGRAGAAVDRAIMGRVATATIRTLLERLAQAIADPAPQAQPDAAATPRWWPVIEAEES